jgi:hypothetical protein
MVNATTPPSQGSASLTSRSRSDYVRPREVADFLRCSLSTLEAKRSNGSGPPFIKPTPRQVLYQVGDVLDWLAAHPKLQSTSDPAGALRARGEAPSLEGWLLQKPANRGASESSRESRRRATPIKPATRSASRHSGSAA